MDIFDSPLIVRFEPNGRRIRDGGAYTLGQSCFGTVHIHPAQSTPLGSKMKLKTKASLKTKVVIQLGKVEVIAD